MSDWSIAEARRAYGIDHWSGGYFSVNSQGHLMVQPEREPGRAIDLHALASQFANSGELPLPVLVRFTGILTDRVAGLVGAFDQAMESNDYQGRYTAVYPIKVNQQRAVVETILNSGSGRVGLEAGSKPELMAVMALVPRGGVVVCNGYKDREYIRLALIGLALGLRVYIVIEKRSELAVVLEEAAALGVEPLLGVRVRLSSIGLGKWQNSGGEKSKFGLSAGEILALTRHLEQVGKLHTLKLLHCHMGSQIANIRDIQRGARELSRFYAEVRALGAEINVIDVGGGLGVDYEGSRSRSSCSMNYSLDEYAQNIVRALWEVCSDSDLPHPDIFSESGRALTAHHAVLVTNVVEVEQVAEAPPSSAPGEDEPLILHDLWEGLENLESRPLLEAYHDAVHWLNEAQSMYTHGLLSLAQRAQAEQLYFATCRRIRALLQPSVRAHREVIDELNEKLADKYFCNFSLFQSMPDIWGISQIFPIVPLSRLDEPPSRRAVIDDLTCDSDGRIKDYVDREGIETTLPLHPLKPGEPYLLGFFMIGAYQEILGDLHNLFGDTNAVNAVLDADGRVHLEGADRGDTIDELLSYVHFDPQALMSAYRNKVAIAGLTPEVAEHCLASLAEGLTGYTYLEE